MRHWIFNCREVTRLVSESLDRDLPLLQRMGIRIHLVICRYCSRYKKQILFLRAAMRKRPLPDEEAMSSPGLTPEAQERIKKILRKHTET